MVRTARSAEWPSACSRCNRPLGLSNLLDALANIDDPGASYAVSLVVVDNDAGQSAKATVSDYQNDRYRWPLSYVCEPVRGIPFARNRALAAAAGSEFIVFVDDDEVPDRGWLHELLRVQRETGADVVEGRVDSVFASPPAKWITNSGLFVRPRRRTGEELAAATTSNVLFNAAIVPANEPAFDERMRFTGGSDTHFFMSARLAGHRIVWADDAIVTETVPATRATLGWLLRREYRRGNTLERVLAGARGFMAPQAQAPRPRGERLRNWSRHVRGGAGAWRYGRRGTGSAPSRPRSGAANRALQRPLRGVPRRSRHVGVGFETDRRASHSLGPMSASVHDR